MPALATHSVLVDLPPAEAWTRLSDLTLAPHYVPGLTGCYFHPGPTHGLGSSRRVLRKYGQWLDESVTDWQDGSSFVLRLHKETNNAPFPFRQASFHYALKAEGSGSRITTSMHYSLRGGRLFEALLRSSFDQVVRQIGENLKAYYETGQTQNRDFAN